MADLNIAENVSGWLNVDQPLWLLTVLIPLALLIVRLLRKRRINEYRRFRNPDVLDETLVSKQAKWPSRFVTTTLLLSMVAMAFVSARPVNNTIQTQEKALLIWVYDASESMTTVDVATDDGDLVSRLDASIAALENSLPNTPEEAYKLLVSFAGPEEVEVNLPTLNPEELLAQADSIQRGERTATDFGLERAVAACQQFFNSQDDYPCEVFLLSDGECNPRPACKLRSESIATEAADKGIVIHTVSWGDPSSEYRPNPADMETIAAITGGTHLTSAKTSELTELYDNVAIGLEVQHVQQPLAMAYVWGARVFLIILGAAFLALRKEQAEPTNHRLESTDQRQ